LASVTYVFSGTFLAWEKESVMEEQLLISLFKIEQG